MKKFVLLLLSILGVSIISLAWFINSLMPLNKNNTPKRFEITPGKSASQIGKDLQSQGFIKNSLSFRIYSQITQAAKNIKPGTYELSTNLWTPQIINKLLEGPTESWITIPEGFRREEIARKFTDNLGLKANETSSFYNEFLKLTSSKEGYLFPDTYLVPKDSKPSEIIKTLEDNFKKRVNFPADYSTIILASIIERETKTDEERPVVAGILLKRINAGWPLQADATIQYVIGEEGNYWPTVGAEDLKINSSYNTYINTGLPPTPICNPGLSSIKAAANPKTSDYWYYLHDNNGQIHYAKTIEEQNENIQKYL